MLERLRDGPFRADLRELLGHQAAGRARRVAQKALGLRRVPRGHLREQTLSLPLREVFEEERDLVARDLVELRAELLGRGPVKDEAKRFTLQLREDGRSLLGRQRLEERSEERRVGKECRSRWSP